MKHFILFCSLVFVLSACKYENEWHQINTKNSFTVDMPDYMKESTKLREDASLQYENRYRNTYAIVIEHEKKDMDLATFDKQVILPLTKYVDKPIITDSAEIKVGNLTAKMNKIMGEMPSGDDKENIYYIHYSVDGKKKYYEICTWTRGPKRLNQYGKDLEKIMNSFKEI